MFIDRKTYIVKRTMPPNVIYRFNTISIKIPAATFVEIDKLILKFIRKCKGPEQTNNLEKKSWKIQTPQFQNYNKCTVIKMACCYHKDGI